MKTTLFSFIFALAILHTLVFGETAATTDELLDYIKNPPPVTKSDWSKPPSPALEAFLEKLAGKENKTGAENQMRPGETAADYIKRINIENQVRELYGDDKMPDPTVSTTQNPPNNGEVAPPSLNDSPKPVITDPSQWMPYNGGQNNQIQTPTSIPLLDQIVPPSFGGQPLNNILNQLFWIGLVIAVILAIVMIIRGGVEYMTIDAISSKESGKNRVKAALGGLLLAFSAILILNTINPGLTNLKIGFEALKTVGQVQIGGGLTSGTRVGTDANGNPIYVPSTPSGEGEINPMITAYSPQKGGDSMEGGYESSKPGLDGKSVVRTLDDYASGNSPYLTLAGDPSLYGKSYIIPQITYTNSSGQSVTLNNVKGYVHDTGSAFTGQGGSRIDIPVGKDYGSGALDSQPFSKQNIKFIPAK